MIVILLQLTWQNFESRIGGEKISSLLWCIGIIIGTLLLKKPAAWLITRISSTIASRFAHRNYSEKFRKLIQSPLESLLQTVLFYIAINQLDHSLNRFVIHRYKNLDSIIAIRFGDVIDHIFLFLIILFVTLILSRIVDFVYHVQQDKAVAAHNRERQQLLPLLKEMFKLVVWSMGAFWLLGSVFHVNIPALITGLGIGGVAIALAAKESVENFFAAFTILTDKPFHSGDTIKLGVFEGTVERIGFRSTRLRNADGSSYIIPNKKLVNENLENLTQRDIRRVHLLINIKYGISHDDMRAMIHDLKHMLRETMHVTGPLETNIDSFGENTLQLAVSYHLPEPLPAGASVNAIKEEINLQVYNIVNRYTTPTVAPADTASTKRAEDGGEKSTENSDDTVL